MKLEALLENYPLSPRWQNPQVFRDEFVLGDFKLPVTGLLVKDAGGLSVTGSAAGVEESLSLRCYFELLERTSIIEAETSGAPITRWDRHRKQKPDCPFKEAFPVSPEPEKWRYAKSNGVAAHVDWQSACEAAEGELIERHRVLRSWFGGAKPEKLALSKGAVPASLWEHYRFEGYLLPAEDGTGWEACAAFGWPLKPDAPMIYGFGARRNRPDALALAIRECLQRLGFLWGEAIPKVMPSFSPSPEYHQELYLHEVGRARLAEWLERGHAVPGSARPPYRAEFTFVDLTPAHLRGKLFVAKAMGEGLSRLHFGVAPSFAPAGFPADLLVHPIM